MKKNPRLSACDAFIHIKALRIMRLILFMITLGSVQLLAEESNEHPTKFSLDLKNVKIEEVLDAIENMSEFYFMYNENQVDMDFTTSAKFKDKSIYYILQTIFEGHNITYKVIDRQIILSKKSVEPVQAQQLQNISGTVVEVNGESIPGVSVVIKGTTNGTITDVDGNFELSGLKPSTVLIFSFIGIKTQEILVNGQLRINVTMEEEMIGLDEVVAIGYGTAKKATITGAITTINNDELKKVPSANVANALTGRLSGVTFIQQSGQPGADDPIIRIRGISSLGDPLGSGNDPLVLVDGVERSFTRIDPEEIENVTVLKDAASTAVYGVRGANGVILVTTRRGESGKAKITYSGQVGLQEAVNPLQYTSAYEYAILVNEGQTNDGILPENLSTSPEELEKYRTNSDPYFYPSMNWTDYLLKSVAPQHKHNFNIQGGSEKLRYFVSLGALSQQGIFKEFDVGDHNSSFNFKRYNFRSNFDFDITKSTRLKITLGGNTGSRNGPSDEGEGREGNFWFDLQQSNPLSSLGIIDGKRIISEDRIGSDAALKSLYFNGFTNIFTSDVNFDANISQDLSMILDGLKIHGKVAYDSFYSHTKDREKTYPVYHPRVNPYDSEEVVFVKRGQEGGLGYEESFNRWKKIYSEFAINYDHTFADNHNIGLLALYNQQKRWYPNLEQEDIPTAYVGFVGRMTYNYKLKYLFDFNLGYNGSENFAPGKRFGLFPAVSAGWVASEEPFIKDALPFMDYIKFRASYGKVGKDNLGTNRFYYLSDRYEFGGGYYFGTTTSRSPGAAEATLGNPDVGWEIAEKLNYAIELKTFRQRLSLVFEYFTEHRTKILINRRTVPAVVAATLPPQNLGIVDNKGIEAEFKWVHNLGDFRYNIGGNFAFVKNHIIFNDEPLGNYDWQWETGRPVGQHFGYKFDGFFKDEADIAASPQYYEGAQPGDAKYVDINKDGVITSADITAIGYPKYPQITYGINGGLEYNDFDFRFLFQGAARVSIALSDEFIIPYSQNGAVMKYIWEERWTPETAETATYPRLISAPTRDHNNYMQSSLWIKDASYFRLKNVDVGYTFRKKPILNKLGINSFRVGLNGVNLLTFTPLTASDPEAKSGRTQLYPIMKVYNLTVNIQF